MKSKSVATKKSKKNTNQKYHHKIISWQNPINFAQKISDNYKEEDWVFLYSALHKSVKNSISYIALFPQERILCDDFSILEKTAKKSDSTWFGYLSYEIGKEFEQLPKTKNSFINLPKINFIKFGLILQFNHDKKILTATFSEKNYLDCALQYKAKKPPTYFSEITKISSNFSDKSYLKTVEKIRKKIAQGDLFQANLTRKFFGEFNKKNSANYNFLLFKKLCKSSPANYASFLKLQNTYIISSSPELFLKIKNNKIISRPIKGTVARGRTTAEDKTNKEYLKNSLKEKAENLMIVDLMRNDLSRICKAGTVLTKKLFEITSYKNLHHMSSEIHGTIDKRFNIFDAIRSCFPPGSMTGAPKVKAMEIISDEEKLNRGIYSGAIGFIKGTRNMNLSVVIRTLIIKEKKFEFQSGSAITYESDAISELKEIYTKSEKIRNILFAQDTSKL